MKKLLRSLTAFSSLLFVSAPALSTTPRPLPATAQFVVQLPGTDRHRFATVTVDITRGDAWRMEGCVSAVGGSCRRSTQRTLTQAQRMEYAQHWTAAYATPRCEPEGIFPGDGTFSITPNADPTAITGAMPANEAQLATRNQGPCRAYARLALWVAQTFTAP